MPVPKGMDPVLWYKIENSRKKDSKMAVHPKGDENDSYLKPGQKDVDDTPGKKYPQTGGPMPKFQMPGNKTVPGANKMNKDILRKSAIAKRLGK